MELGGCWMMLDGCWMGVGVPGGVLVAYSEVLGGS